MKFKGMLAAAAALAATHAHAVEPPAAPGADRAAFRVLFEQLVEIDTTLSKGSCTAAAQAMADRLLAAGYPINDVRVLVPEGRPKDGALAATLQGTDNTLKPLLLLAHLDVVEANRADWERDPFTLIEENGVFYGRGVADDKAQAAIWVDSLVRYMAEGFRPRRDIKVALTCGEETADTFNGVEYLLEHDPEVLTAGFALNEGAGGRLDLQGRPVALGIQAGEKVYQDFIFEVTNAGGHSSAPIPDNAIRRLSAALGKITPDLFPVALNGTTRAYFAEMAKLTPQHAADMRAVAGARVDQAAATRLAAADKGWNSTMRTTCVPTTVAAGHAPNALPQRATANVNCRILPGVPVAEVQAALARTVADSAVKITAIGTADASTPPPLNETILGPVRTAAAKIWPGVPVIPTQATGATDGRFLLVAGIPTYGLTGLFAPPEGSYAHGLNERLPVKSVYDARDFLYEIVKLYASPK